jgi:SAM-dependent methyltransferase
MTLAPGDRAALDKFLAREWDFAFARRTRLLFEDLDPRPGERILDCGCGIGFHLLLLQAWRGVAPSGIDADVGRLRKADREGARSKVAGAALPRLPFRDGTFDKVLASEVLEHLPDDRAALAELFRVLKPGGILAISVPHARYPFWWDPISRVWGALGGNPIRRGPLVGIWTGHERLYLPENLAARASDAGFRVERCVGATQHAFPFSHLLLYGIGKPLLERRLLPASVTAGADRLAVGSGGPHGPLSALRALLARVDARNEGNAAPMDGRYVNVVLRARKPEQR